MADGDQVTQGASPAGGPGPVSGQTPGSGSPGTADSGAAALPAGGATAVAAGAPQGQPSPGPAGAAATHQATQAKVDPWAALEEANAKLKRQEARTAGLQPELQKYQEMDKQIRSAGIFDGLLGLAAAAQHVLADKQVQQPNPAAQPTEAVTAPPEQPSERGYQVPPWDKERALRRAASDFNAEHFSDGSDVTPLDREQIARHWEAILRGIGVTEAELPWPSRLARAATPAPAAQPPAQAMTPADVEAQVMAEHRRERQFRSELEALASPDWLGQDWFTQQVEFRGENMSRRDAVEVYCDLMAARGEHVAPAEALMKLWPRDTLRRYGEISEQRGRNSAGPARLGMPGGGVPAVELSPDALKAREEWARAHGLVTDKLTTVKPSWMGKDEIIMPTVG